jgi:hypothetical protein
MTGERGFRNEIPEINHTYTHVFSSSPSNPSSGTSAAHRLKEFKLDVKDPQYQRESKRIVMDFLITHGLPQVNAKMLNSPTQQVGWSIAKNF